MNAIKIFFLLLFFSRVSNAQLNLVPNPSFEDTVYCPNGFIRLDACQSWLNFGNSPDYWNSCTPIFGIPNNPSSLSYQYAHSGNGMAGLVLYRRPNAPSGPNSREFIGVQLTQPLSIGQKYFFSCYINFTGNPLISIACNKFGANFSTQSNDSCCPPLLNNNPKIYSDSILSDSVQWFRISESFIADSAYMFLGLGNFFTDSNTDTLHFGTYPDVSYYYVDNVCLTTDSIYNETWTGLQNSELNEIHIWPNPIKNYFQFSAKQKIDEVAIYDCRGKLIKSENVNALEGRIEFDVLSAGIYFAVFRRERDFSVQKFLKF